MKGPVCISPAPYVGTPWRRLGRDPKVALDCWGLVMLCLPGVPDYASGSLTLIALVRATAAGWEDPRWRALSGPSHGCLVMLDRTHAGVLWQGRVFNAIEPDGVRADPLEDLPTLGFRRPTFAAWEPWRAGGDAS